MVPMFADSAGKQTEPAGVVPDWEAAVADAIRAPSSHNSQPWHFVVDDTGIDVRADFSRSLPVADPRNRELFISCGAALEQLLISVRVQGFNYRCRTNDDPGDAQVARVQICGRRMPDPEDERLQAAIPKRRTSRVPFEMLPLPRALQVQLRGAAAQRDTTLIFAETSELNRLLMSLTMDGDRRQSEDRAFRAELAKWMRPNHSDAPDGMRGESFGLDDFAAYIAPLAIRTFDLGDSNAARDEALITASPMLAILCTVDDGKYDWITSGRALARVALTATAAGYSLSFLNQSVEVPPLRDQLAHALGEHRRPQLVIRLGRAAEKIAATPRRAVAEVLSAARRR